MWTLNFKYLCFQTELLLNLKLRQYNMHWKIMMISGKIIFNNLSSHQHFIVILIHCGDYSGRGEKGGWGGQWTMHLHILHHHLPPSLPPTLPPSPPPSAPSCTVQFNAKQRATQQFGRVHCNVKRNRAASKDRYIKIATVDDTGGW